MQGSSFSRFNFLAGVLLKALNFSPSGWSLWGNNTGGDGHTMKRGPNSVVDDSHEADGFLTPGAGGSTKIKVINNLKFGVDFIDKAQVLPYPMAYRIHQFSVDLHNKTADSIFTSVVFWGNLARQQQVSDSIKRNLNSQRSTVNAIMNSLN